MPRPAFAAALLVVMSLLSACATQSAEQRASGEIFDPYERTNRSMHEVNKAMDRAIFRPASNGYVKIIPDSMVTSFSHFSQYLSLPGDIVNALLQGDLRTAGNGTMRFLINTTVIGLGDPATDFEIPPVDTDFGETLHVWGFKPGAYIELPLLGPSNTRDAVGILVDFFTNPLSMASNPPIDNLGLYAEVLERMGDRGNFSDTVDSILYESADSYAQSRIIFTQNRQFELEGDNPDAYFDPYDDLYAD
ncbi:MAG: VacJ family lipoprotein [Rhodobacteraceae bacterium]|nr:VacJ family lipoprotein [Paracoccaceae bacterium]